MEIKQLFSETYGFAITEEQAEKIDKFCSGWPFGINLVARYLRRLYNDPLPQTMELQNLFYDKDFSEYLADEFLKDLPQAARKFLINSSIFDYFSIETCEEVLAENNADEIIGDLLEQGLIRVKWRSGEYWYEYPELLRNYYLHILKEQVSSGYLSKLDEITGLYFASQELPLKAMDHFVKAQAYEKVVIVLKNNLDHFIDQSMARNLLNIIEKIPESYINFRPILSFAKGWALFFLGNFNEALQFLQTALNLAQKEDLEDVRGKAIRFIAYIYFSLDCYGKLISFVTKRKDDLAYNSPAYPEVLQILAQALGQLGRMREAEAVWRALEEHPLFQETTRSALIVSAVKAYNYSFLRGHFHDAEQEMCRALEALHTEDEMVIHARVLGYYSSLKYIQGHFNECHKLVSRAVSECRKTNQVFAQEPFLLLQALNALDSGKPETARKALDKFRGQGKDADDCRIGRERYIWKGFLFHAAEAGLYSYEGNLQAFSWHAQKAIEMVDRKESFLDIYLLYTFLASRQIRLKVPEYAQKLLEKLESLLDSVDNPYFLAHTWLLLASAFYCREVEDFARLYLKKAIHAAKQYGYEYLFLYKERETTQQLRQLLVEEEEDFDFIAHILVQLDSTACQNLCRSLKEEEKAEKKICIIQALADNACRDYERQIRSCTLDKSKEVRRTARAAAEKLRSLPPQPLTVQTFGRFKLKVGPREIPPGAWKRKKATSLLVYFLLHSNRKIELEKLMELFFPEASPRKAKSHLQSLISHLRLILEPGLPPKKESKYIRSEVGGYLFELPENFYVDVIEFDRLANKAARVKREGDYGQAFAKYQKAEKIYQGDFLPETVYEEWIEICRSRYKEEYIKVLYGLAYGYYDRKQYTDCEKHLQNLLLHNPFDEKAYLLLMKCYIAWGHRTQAIKTYIQCRDVLEKELGILPENPLTNLYKIILDPEK